MGERGSFEFRFLPLGLSGDVDKDDQQEKIPRVKELLNELRSRSGLSSLDLVSGYYQISLMMERSVISTQPLPEHDKREHD